PPFTPRHFEHGDYFVFWAPVVADISPPDVDELYFNVQGAATPHQEVIGLVAVSLSTALVKHHRRQILIGTVASSLFLFLLCCTTFFIILRHFTKPLGKLISEVNTFGVSSTANLDDMNVLTDTYTTMVEALSDAFETIHGMKKDLEKKVVERTEELASANKNLALREKTLTASNQRLSKTLDELKNAQAQLVQSEKMAGLGQMVAGIAHEVNNTVNFIATSLPLLRKRLEHLWEETGHGADRRPLTEEQRQMLAKQTRTLVENIEEGTRRTADIVRDLQTFSRADAADLQRHFIHEGLESTLAIMPPDFRNRIEVIRDYDPELPSVVCYPGQINQVFLNILLNAMQAIPDQGTIRIRTWHDAERVHVSIRDSGPGIPDQVFPKMFDPFFTTKEVGKGTGLGLGICYQIVDRHRGRIMVRNAKGGGAEFEIILPLHPEEEGSGEPSAGRPREKTKNIDSRPPLH
ncbi:MAG: ATP-binding protein, partial [Desulfobulbaceae bacterium]|nr:ATP-binding protein [Desulfobulbaceae bacterium]